MLRDEIQMLVRGLLLTVILGMPATAQRPSSWVPLALPSGYVAANTSQLGKVCTYREGQVLWFFSGFARTWQAANLQNAAATVRVFNDLAFAVDTGQIVAFASYRGTVEILPVSPSATVVNPPTQRNDSILVVLDGNTVWAFSAFRGQWTSLPLTSGPLQVVTQRQVALVADGSTLYGMSAFTGSWVQAAAVGPVSRLAADGSWGTAEAGSTLYGFSAQRASWSSAPLPGGAQRLNREDCTVHWNATSAVAYSGLRGTFAATVVAPVTTVQADAVVVAAQTGPQIEFFSAVLGTWTLHTTTSPATVTVRPHLVTVNDGGRIAAFSPFRGNVAMTPFLASVETGNQGVAAAVDQATGALWLYSALTGAWTPAPASASAVLPRLIWCGAMLDAPNGYYAFSGRSGRFVLLQPGAGAVPHYDSNSSVLAVEDSASLHVFEPRREVWLSTPKRNPNQPLAVVIWRTTLLAVDGAFAHGYGTQAGEVETWALPAAPTEFGANSESLRAATGSTLAAFGGTPDVTTLYQYPEFRRVFAAGSDLEIQLHAEPSAPHFLTIGTLGAVPVSLPPYGDLYADPASLTAFGFGVVPADGRATVRLPVPDLPSLRGFEVCFQGMVQPAAGTAYITRLTTVRVQ
jgi:hypothetical protein